jgi:hypothetical protein
LSIGALLSANAQAAFAHTEPDGIPDGQKRLELVGYRLGTANADLCADPQMLTGLTIYDISAYSAPDRPLAGNLYNLSYGFAVLNIVPESSAAQAGFQLGDEIIGVNGSDLAGFANTDIRSRPSYARTEKFIAYLDRALREGPAQLRVRRGDAVRTVMLTGDRGCGGRVAYLRRNKVNAWSDGRYVAVTQRMMSFAADDQELAFVVAHEMAHNILRHTQKLDGSVALLAQFGIGAGKIKKTEIEADELAVKLMERADFDPTASARLLRKTSKIIPVDLGLTHPRVHRRVEIVTAAIARLDATQTN